MRLTRRLLEEWENDNDGVSPPYFRNRNDAKDAIFLYLNEIDEFLFTFLHLHLPPRLSPAFSLSLSLSLSLSYPPPAFYPPPTHSRLKQ
jgi:hypothetical protein